MPPSALLKALKKSPPSVADVERAITPTTDLNERVTTEKLTLLMFATQAIQDVNIMKLLIEKGADVKLVNKYGRTALHYAAAESFNGMGKMKLLIEKGADVNAKDKYDSTPLHTLVIRTKDVDAVKFLVENGADVNAVDNFGNTVLNYAKTVEIAKFLVEEKGLDVNKPNKTGETPLMSAASMGIIEVVQYLIQKGANVKILDKKRIGILHYTGNPGIIKLLVEAGADINNRNPEGKTPLFNVLMNATTNTTKYLIEKGADVNAKDNIGMTPLHQAAVYFYLEQAKVLIENGADVNSLSNTKLTPLMVLIINSLGLNPDNGIAVVKLLIEKGADVNIAQQDGLTALHYASQISVEFVKPIVESGADVNKAAKDGRTPLMEGAKINNYNIVKYLLEKGATKDMKDESGKTALDLTTDAEVRALLQQPTETTGEKFKGFSKSDVHMMVTQFFEKPSDYSVCPFCLAYVERREGCMYMSHSCINPHKKLYALYSYEGKIEWCTLCGRPSKHHRHYAYAPPDATTLPPFAPVQSTATGDFRFFDKDCKASGGGGHDEKVRRFNRMFHYACELQAEVGKITHEEAMKELVEETWKGADIRMRNVPKIIEQKKFDFPCEFGEDKAEATAEETYPDIKKPEGLQPNPIRHDGKECLIEGGVPDNNLPVYQFFHKQPDGTMWEHKDEYICAEDLVQLIKSRTMDGTCPINRTNCKGKIYPEELKDITPDFYEVYRSNFNKANAVKTGGAETNVFNPVDMDTATCAPFKKTAGRRRKTYRKKHGKHRTYRKIIV